MPAAVQKRRPRAVTSLFLQSEGAIGHHAASIMTRTVRFRRNVRSDTSKADCKGHKPQGLDSGPCGNNVVNYTSIALIIFCIASLCLAVYLKTCRPRVRTRASVRPQPVVSPYHDRHTERRARTQQERVVQQRRSDECRWQNTPVRAITDLSGQQTQLAERLTQLQERLESARGHERRDNERAAAGTGLLTPEAVHARDRERDWEHYQRRSTEDVVTRPEHADSIVQQVRSNGEEDSRSNNPWRQHFVSEPLPKYTAEDPLTGQARAPAYAP